jgi:hypothetical protein
MVAACEGVTSAMSRAAATGADLPGWQVVVGGSGEMHVIPIADRLRHDVAPSCRCCPKYDECMWVHNAFDKREMLEG